MANQVIIDAHYGAVKLSAYLSMAGSMIILLSLALFRSLQRKRSRLVASLAVANLIRVIDFPATEGINPALCRFQAFVPVYFELVCFAWSAVISLHLYMLVVQRQGLEDRFWYFALGAWGIPALIASIPLIDDHYGYVQSYCYIKDDEEGNAWRFGVIYGPCAVTVLFVIAVYWRLYQEATRTLQRSEGTSSASERKVKKTIEGLLWFPMVMVLSYITMIVYRGTLLADGAVNREDSVVYLVADVLYYLQGLFECLVFISQKAVRAAWWKGIRNASSRNPHSESQEASTDKTARFMSRGLSTASLLLPQGLEMPWRRTEGRREQAASHTPTPTTFI